jgi:AraC family transcriptional regulator of arabinose operon
MRPTIAEGFPGQRLVVVPPPVVAEALRTPPTCELLPTDCGFFPVARHHGRHRARGVGQWILIACLRGSGWAEIDGQRHHVGAGSLLAIPPDTPHAYGAETDDPWTILWIHLVGRQIHAWQRRLGLTTAQPLRDLPAGAAVTSHFDRVLAALEQGVGIDDLLTAAADCWPLLACLATGTQANARTGIAAALDLMRSRLTAHLPVAEMAAAAGLSSSRFAACFRAQVGCPPLTYHLRLRMRHAAALLESGDASIAAIAASVGYDDPFYFSRRFHAVYGVSPRDWRRRSG